MDKIRAVIADDEHHAIDLLQKLLIDSGKVDVVKEVQNSLMIESAINKHNPDVLFLDVEMPGINGMELLKNIREYNNHLQIILVTAFDKYMSRAIKLNVFSYLLKPVDKQELYLLVDKLSSGKKDKQQTSVQKLKLPVKGGYVYIKPDELLVLEAEGNYTRIQDIYGEEFLSSYNMGRLYQKLPQSFFRINRSCVLNSEFIYKINKNDHTCKIRLDNKEIEYEVSSSFITEFNRKHK